MNKFKLIVYSLLRIKQYNTNENINILLNNFKLYYGDKAEKDFNIIIMTIKRMIQTVKIKII